MNLLADLCWCLVDGGDGFSYDSGSAVGSWDGNWGRGSNGVGSWGDGWGSNCVSSWCNGRGHAIVGRGSTASSGEKSKDDQWVHFCSIGFASQMK